MGSCDFEKYLLVLTSESMSIWDVSIFQSHMTKYIVMMGRNIPAVLLFRGIPAVQLCWSTETSPEWRYLQYCFKTYISIWHCSVPLSFQILQYLHHVRQQTKGIYDVKEISQAKTNRHKCLFQIHTLSS